MTDAPMSVWQIDRNDVAACVAYHETHGATEDDCQVMLMLQDDPAELRRAMRTWTVRQRTA